MARTALDRVGSLLPAAEAGSLRELLPLLALNRQPFRSRTGHRPRVEHELLTVLRHARAAANTPLASGSAARPDTLGRLFGRLPPQQRACLRPYMAILQAAFLTAAWDAWVAAAADAYLRQGAAAGWADRTRAKYAQVLGRLVRFSAGRRVTDLTGLTRPLAEAYLVGRAADGAAPKTMYLEGTLIRQLVKHALACDLLAADPLKGWAVKKPRRVEPPCWVWPDVLRVLAASPPAVRPALTLLAQTGLRVGELAWLTWADVDHQAGVLRVRAKDGWRLKAGDAWAVPLTPPVRAVLDHLPQAHRWGVTMPPSATHPGTGRQRTERRRLAALKRVVAGLELPGHLHTFRRSFVSHAVAAGTPPAVVKKWVGHVSVEMLAHYTHVHDAVSRDAMRRLFGEDETVDGK